MLLHQEGKLLKTMSFKETSAGHGSVKKVLRRKLTSPPHLLLGKSKAKNGTGGGSVRACRHNGSNNRCNVTEASGRSCEEETSEEVAAKSTTESQRVSDNKEQKEIGNWGTTAKSPLTDQTKAAADKSEQNQVAQKRTVLKQVFSPSVACFRCIRTPDEGEYDAVTFFNRQTRDSVDLTAQSALIYSNDTKIHQDKSAVAKGETSKTRTFKLFKRLIVDPKCQSKAKSVAPENSVQRDTLIPCSFKKQPKTFWRHKPKKPSPFFQECIGESKDYIEEETIVLANKHTDDHIVKSVTLSPHLENVLKCHCREMLTVSVDVSSAIKDAAEIEGARASETPSHVRTEVKVMVQLQGNLGEGLIEGKETRMKPLSLEERCNVESSMVSVSQGFGVCQNVDISHGQHGINSPTIISALTASEPSSGGKETSLHPSYKSDSNTAHQDASAGNDRNTPGGNVTDDGAIAGDLHLDMTEGVHPCIEQSICTDTFCTGAAHSEENAEQGCDEMEMLLMETACSVVQAAMKAALDQCKGELMDSGSNVD